MKTITITLTDSEYKALSYVAVSPEEWIDNLVKTRISNAVDEIVKIEVDNRFKNNLPIPSDKLTIVDESKLPSAKERNELNKGNLNASN